MTIRQNNNLQYCKVGGTFGSRPGRWAMPPTPFGVTRFFVVKPYFLNDATFGQFILS